MLAVRETVLEFGSLPGWQPARHLELAALPGVLAQLMQVSFDGQDGTSECDAAPPPPPPPLRPHRRHKLTFRPPPSCAGFVTPQAISSTLDITAMQTKVCVCAGREERMPPRRRLLQ